MERKAKSEFDTNPYAPPEVRPDSSDETDVAIASMPLWKLLIGVVVIEAASTSMMARVHHLSPQVYGINVYAIVQMFLSCCLGMVAAWFVARCQKRSRYLLSSQVVNLTIWASMIVVVQINWPGTLRREGRIFFVLVCIGAILSLITSLVARALANRSRANAVTTSNYNTSGEP